MAIGPITITYEREQYIDFTKPFMNLGLSILFKRPEPRRPGLFSFMEPLEKEVVLKYSTVVPPHTRDSPSLSNMLFQCK